MNIIRNIRQLKILLDTLDWIFYKECGKTFILKHKNSKIKTNIEVIPMSLGYAFRDSESKHISVKTITELKKLIKKSIPK